MSEREDDENSLEDKKIIFQNPIFSDDICFEIISMMDNSWFVLQNCTLISKQFFNVIKERAKLIIHFQKKLEKERIDLLMESQFIDNIISVKLVGQELQSISFLNEFEQLESLYVSGNQIGLEGAKSISELTQLTSLDIDDNQIGSKGVKLIGELTELTSLDTTS